MGSVDVDELFVFGAGEQNMEGPVGTITQHGGTGPVALEITMEEYAYEAEKYYAKSLEIFDGLLKGGTQDA